MDCELAIHTIRESCCRVGYPTHDAEYERRILINQSCYYAIDCIEKIDKIEQIMEKYQDTLDNFYGGKPRDLLESDVLRDVKEVLE